MKRKNLEVGDHVGYAAAAMTQEAWCDRIYRQLPEWAKW